MYGLFMQAEQKHLASPSINIFRFTVEEIKKIEFVTLCPLYTV